MTGEQTLCVYCDQPVSPGDYGTLKEVRGWVAERKQGGANAVSFRRDTGRYAHGSCAELQKRGVHRDQGRLI